MRRLIKHTPFILLVVALLWYTFSRVQNLVFGPSILVNFPLDGAVLSDDRLTMTGTIQNASHITLNGRKIFTDENGVFTEKLLLHYGYNILELSAEDRFEKETKKRIHIIYQ